MNTSKYIARLMGPVLAAVGIGMAMGLLMEGEGYSSLLKEFIGSRSVIFITGILALLAGLAIVNAHNLWVPDWRAIVTVLGWLLVLRGIMLLVFPAAAQTIGDRMAASEAGAIAGAALSFVLGAILCIMGYEELYAGKPRRASSARASTRTRAAPTRSAKRPRRRKR